MKKVVSNEQRLANRQNARQSTGPKTPDGKARTSRNALKHGLLARDVVIGGPDTLVKRLRELEDQLHLDGVILEPNPGGKIPLPQMMRSLELLARDVTPALR